MASSSHRPPRRTDKNRRSKPAPRSTGVPPVPDHGQDGRATSLALRPALNLLPYQRRWVEDCAPLKIVVKARQIGYSFADTQQPPPPRTAGPGCGYPARRPAVP